MCPIPAMAQFYVVLVFLLLLIHGIISETINCEPKELLIKMYDTVEVNCNITTESTNKYSQKLWLKMQDGHIASTSNTLVLLSYIEEENHFKGNFNVTGLFLGITLVSVNYKDMANSNIKMQQEIPITVIRKERVVDHVFTGSIILLVSLIYINFGCALNWSELKNHLKKPIGPVIGCVGQFIIMPLLSYSIGKALFPNNTAMQLGMFFTGVSPGGGASNMWTVILGGNINLSITMTTISTIAALGIMPLWLFTLGKTLFDASDIPVPYGKLTTFIVGLVVPLFVGYLMQRYLARVAQVFARMLKCFSAILLLFIIIFAIATNLYLFKLFSYQIVVAGLLLPLIGYVAAWLMAKFLKQPLEDCLTIAIETGIQNTGIAIFLLRVALPKPNGDLTTVIPVAVATMTPLPLLILYIWQKLNDRCCTKNRNLTKSLNDQMNAIVVK